MVEGREQKFSNLMLLKVDPEKLPENPKTLVLTYEFLRYLVKRYEAQGRDPKEVTLKEVLQDLSSLIGRRQRGK